ncbi:MAG: GNAT family N-acetyltransferase [Clostridiales bacterium]|nr:GNAT family N-acetyltransferase [Clostridiales bacterium]
MSDISIRKIADLTEEISIFTDEQFSQYATSNGVDLNYEDFIFAAEDENGKLVGVIIGRAYYDEVHIGDLVIDETMRRNGLGSRLVEHVEKEYGGRGYSILTLTTFGFQAPEFYRKLGFELEFVRENKDPKLSKYFFRKALS